MTSPMVIRGVEQNSRWFDMDRLALLTSEGKGRMLGGGIRLRPVIRYGFILLALCMMLSDTFRLAFLPSSAQNTSLHTQSARSVRTVPGNSHARLTNSKRHSGI